jgi:hypothetical protein
MKNIEVNLSFDEKVFGTIMEGVFKGYTNEWIVECGIRDKWEFRSRIVRLKHDKCFREVTRKALKLACGLDCEGEDLTYIVNESVEGFLEAFDEEFDED